jgi:HEAT repeat protein
MKISGAVLSVLVTGCATTDIRELARDGENDRLISLWPEAENDAKRSELLDALALHPEPAGRAHTANQVRKAQSPELRVAAIRALSRYPDADVTEAFLDALGDSSPEVRREAKMALAACGPVADRLIARAAHRAESPLVRAAAASLVVEAGRRRHEVKREAQEILRWLAENDPSAPVREESVRGLGRLRDGSARKILVGRVRIDDDLAVRKAAELALKELDAPVAMACAVLPLKNVTNNAEVEKIASEIVEELRARLESAKLCEVLDRDRVSALFDSATKQGRSIYEGETPSSDELQRFHMVDQVVYGSIDRDKFVYTISLGRVAIETREPIAASRVQDYPQEIEQLKREAIDRFLETFSP